MSKARFIKLKKPGIRKDTVTGKYQARKTIRGKTYSKLLDSVREAEIWRNTFNPFEIKKFVGETPTLSELWENYKRSEFPGITESSRETKEYQISIFWNRLADIEIGTLTPEHLSDVIEISKKGLMPNSKRYNYNRPLSELKVILNWYKENVDYTYNIPIQKRHYKQGVIRKVTRKRKALEPKDLVKFLNGFDKEMYRNLALLQFFLGCRVSEIAGLIREDADFDSSTLIVQRTVIWSRYNKKPVNVKPGLKNGEASKTIPLTQNILIRALQEQIIQSANKKYLFSNSDGSLLSYRQIQYQYNRAIGRAGLSDKASSTHFLRHSVATGARDCFGLEAAQALLGHKDLKTTQVYAELPKKLIASSMDGMQKALEENGMDWNKIGTK